MGKIKIDFNFLSLLRDLDKIEKEYNRMYLEEGFPTNFEKFSQYAMDWFKASSIEEKIKDHLSRNTNIIIHDTALSNILNRIRDGKESPCIAIYNKLTEIIQGTEDDYDKYSNDALLEFTGQYDHVKYYLRKRQIGALISMYEIKDTLKDLFFEIRELYALSLDKSCITLCRAILEKALRIKLNNYKDELSELINKGNRDRRYNENLKEKAHRVRQVANDVLHLADDNLTINVSLESVINDTIEFVEHLHNRPRENT